jgi:hypothetical protein
MYADKLSKSKMVLIKMGKIQMKSQSDPIVENITGMKQ